MAVFNWQRFLDDHRIPYTMGGKNVTRGNIGLQCPFCGSADPSQHMGINPANGKWNCWRDRTHRGRKPHRLIQRLLGCSYDRAAQIVGSGVRADPNSFSERAARFRALQQHERVASEGYASIPMPDKFKHINLSDRTARFADYLTNVRGFERSSIKALIDYYDLRGCTYGGWKARLIVPITMNEKLVNWQGRSIYQEAEVRYRSLSTNPEHKVDDDDPVAAVNIKDCLFPFDPVYNGGKVLYIVEGSMDSLKVDFYGKEVGVRATCIFSLDIREEQGYLLRELSEGFDRTILMLDEGAYAQGMRLKRMLPGVIDKVRRVPFKSEDPGELTPDQVVSLRNFELA